MLLQLKPFFTRLLPIACLSLFTSFLLGASADAQSTLSTAIPYQGQLSDGGNPANGQYDFEFKLFDAASAGAQIGSTNSKEDVQVNSGNFAVELDFGGSAFTGAGRFLEIGVRAGNSTGAFTTLAPRRPLLAVPYALYSPSGSKPAYGSAASAPSNVLYVDDARNVGINTTAPRAQLDVVAASDTVARFGATNNKDARFGIASNGVAILSFLAENGQLDGGGVTWHNGIMYDRPNGLLHVRTGNENRLTINQQGNVGIGSLPVGGEKLHVNGELRLSTSGNGATLLTLGIDRRWALRQLGTNQYAALELASLNDAGGIFNKDFIINTTGEVGIGTTGPATTLHVHAATPDIGLTVTAAGKNTGVSLHVADGDYGYLHLGGDTKLRGNGRESVFSGQVSVPTLQIRGGADIAEPFAISGEGTIEPGMVVAIDPDNPGQLRLAGVAYDRTVAAVVSGAGGINPGLILQQEGSVAAGEHPVSLSGRVYVYADATNGAIEPGDLLTTSDTPGHAMKVTDHNKAQGAILGKALGTLAKGKGLVLMLVSLQ